MVAVNNFCSQSVDRIFRANGQIADIRANGDRIFGVSACGTAGLGFVRVHVP